MPTRQIKNSYNKGEMSPYMDGRTDITHYYNGCSKLINALVLPHGGFTKRPGTEYIATAANKCKLFPFEFSVDDALILEFSNLLLRFYKDQAQVLKPLGTEDLAAFDSATGDSSLIVHWKCNDNEATTTVVDGTVAGSHDATATSNTDTLTSADFSGTANTALDFKGTDYAKIANHSDFSFGDGADDEPFSIAVWVNYISSGADQVIISNYQTALREWYLRVRGSSNDRIQFVLYDETNNKTQAARTVASLSDGWHFIVVTYDGRGGDEAYKGIKFYIDWLLWEAVDSASEAGYVAMSDEAAEIVIGATGTAYTLKWDNELDNIAVFNKVLSAVEILTLVGSNSTVPYEIVSPYTSAQAFQIHVTQSADVMYIAHEDHHPQKLSRFGDTEWEIGDVPFKGGPFLDENTNDSSLVGFARTGGTAMDGYYFPTGAIGTLTATLHTPFNSKMVGALWLIKHTRDVDNTTTTFAKDTNVVPTLQTYASGAISIKGDYTVTFEPIATTEEARLWRKQGNGKWQEYRSFRGATAFSGSEDEKDVLFAMTRSAGTINGTLTAKEAVNRGVVKITGYTSSTVVIVEVIDAVLSDNNSDNAVTTPMWAEGAWSDYRGYPRTVTFFEDRLWWASSTNNPDTKWGSKSRLYENMEFTNLGLDDDAIVAPLNDNEISQIQWMFPRIVMAVGAANKEYRFGASNPDNPVTPADRKATPQTSFGSDSIQPVILQDALFFLQRQGKKLRAMKFDSITENFTADDATLLAYGIFDSAPVCMAVQRSPDSIIWIPRADGIIASFTYEPVEEVAGWARQIFGNSAAVETATGYIESVAVIHGSAEDEIWVSVRRVINHNTVYYIEKFKPRDWGNNIEDAFFVDSGLTAFDGGAEKVIIEISKADPCIISSDTHGFTNGQQVYISTKLTTAELAIITAYDINSNDVIDIAELTTANLDNTAGTLSDKLYAVMGDMWSDAILISAVIAGSMDELDDTVYTVNGAAADYFSLKDSTNTTTINSTDFSDYTAGATVKRVENVITELNHLEGEEVAVFADGKVLAKETVSSYQITIDEFANKVQVGIPYTMKARTMRLAVPPPNTIQTRIKRINRTVVRYIRSLLGSAGQEYSGTEYLTDIKATYSTASQDTPKDNRLTRGGFSEDAYTIIVSDDPVPFTCLATIIDVEIE